MLYVAGKIVHKRQVCIIFKKKNQSCYIMGNVDDIMGRFIVELYGHDSFFRCFACYFRKKEQFPLKKALNYQDWKTNLLHKTKSHR
jgi:hypothetical protein